MYDIIIFVVVLLYMAGGYFLVDKVGKYIDKNLKNYDNEIDEDFKNDKD